MFLLKAGGLDLFVFISALARSESKRDGGFKNNWSFDHGEESEGDTDKEFFSSVWATAPFIITALRAFTSEVLNLKLSFV
uniref:Uncharacterized protein n=1 Tax=Capra hircus TaxID=9925 RepID=A0A8C2RG62_CAPHI